MIKGGDFMFRKKMSHRSSKKNWKRGAHSAKRNFSRVVRRGGIRL